MDENDEISELDQQRFNELVTRSKKLVGEGQIEDALKLNKKALAIRYSEKLAKKIKKMEDYLKAHADSSSDEENNGMMHVGKGFYLYHELYDKLYSHQQEGVLWMWNLYRQKKGGLLGDDMGLGKTIQVIAFLSGMFDMTKIHSVLIVLPVAVMVNWDKEFKKWSPGLKVVAYHGNSKREKERALLKVQRSGGICLTTYGLVVTSWEQFGQKHGREFVWDYMILDEGHKIKNPTKTSKGVHAIPAHNRIILTGTPVQNNLKELWALFDFVHQGQLLGTQKTFKMEYDNPITRAREKDATIGEKKLGMEMAESLKKIISPYFLRRTKAGVNRNENKENEQPDEGRPQVKHAKMPTMTRKNDLIVWLFLSAPQLKIYEDFLSLDSVKELLMTTKSPLVALTVLKKICDHPRLLSTRACAQLGIEGDEGLDDDLLETEVGALSAVTRIQHVADHILINESGKLAFLVELLDQLKVEGHRCLVFSQSRKMLDIMQKVITNRGHKVMRLDGTIRDVLEREKRINTFQNDRSYSVFLLTTQVGGVGLTLTAADRVVIFDPSWNPATDAQAVDRAFRIGQEKNVVIYRLITCASVEEKIYRRQIFKDSITRQTTGNTKNPYRYFSKSELRELFTLDEPRMSTTQQQLEQMHSGNRLTDPSLDAHIAYLYSLDMFGLSDHDLMFQGHEDDEDADVEDDADEYIQTRVQKAQELIQMESSQSCTLEERLGKPQQGRGDGEGTGRAPQFESWDFPKPGLHDDEEPDIKPDLDAPIHIADTPGRGNEIDLTSPWKQPAAMETDAIDLTRLDISVTDEMDNKTKIKKETKSPGQINMRPDLIQFIKDEAGLDSIGTPTSLRKPLMEMSTANASPSHGAFKSPRAGKSPRTPVTHTPKTPKTDRILVEEILISPDPSRPLVQTDPQKLNMFHLGGSGTKQRGFASRLDSTILLGLTDSPDVHDQSRSSSHSSSSSRSVSDRLAETFVEDSPTNSETGTRFQRKAVVPDSPSNSPSFQVTGSVENSVINEAETDTDALAESVLDESANLTNHDEEVEESDDEILNSSHLSLEDSTKKPDTVMQIKHILEKSLNNSICDDNLMNISLPDIDSPVNRVKKSSRRSVACRRRVIESSEEEIDDEDGNMDEDSDNDETVEYSVNDGTDVDEEYIDENVPNDGTGVNDSDEDIAYNSDKVQDEKNTESAGDDDEVNEYHEENAGHYDSAEDTDNEGDKSDNDNHDNDEIEVSDHDEVGDSGEDYNSVEMEEEHSENEMEPLECDAGKDAIETDQTNNTEMCNTSHLNTDDDTGGQREVIDGPGEINNESQEEYSGNEDEEDALQDFSCLPMEEQIRYNKLVDAGRVYCREKQFEIAQVHVLQALQIFPDVDLQATALKIQQKVIKYQRLQ